jgi:ribosomal protein L37E
MTSNEWILFPCRKCGTRIITGVKQDTRTCSHCGHRNDLRKVNIIKRFATFAEASDGLRYAKLPAELKDPRATENYRSTAWREK